MRKPIDPARFAELKPKPEPESMKQELQTKIVGTKDLRIGDTVSVWWEPGRDTITAIETFREQSKLGAVGVARFALLKQGMTLFPHDQFELFARQS